MRGITILLCFLSIFCFWEETSAFDEKDSLRNLFYSLDSVDDVEFLLNARLEIIQQLRRSDYELYLEFAHENIELARQHKINWGLVDIYMEMGGSFLEKGSYNIALDYLNRAYKYAQLDEYRPYVGWVTLEIANCYEAMLHYNRAIGFYKISLDVFKETDEPEGIALASANIGVNYLYINDFDKAEQYLNKALTIRKELGDPVELGYVQMYLANLQMKTAKYKEAVQNLRALILDINKRFEDQKSGFQFIEGKTLVGEALGLLAETYGSLGLSGLKYKSYFDAGNVFKELRDSLNLSEVFCLIGESYLNDSEFDKAIVYADSALKVTEGTMILNQQARANRILADAYTEINNTRFALQYFRKYFLIHDSMFNRAVIDAISNVDVLVETMEKEKDNEILQLNIDNEKRLRRIVTLGSLVFLVVLFIALLNILIKLRKLKQLNDELTLKNKKIEEQTKRLEELNRELSQLVKSKDKFHSVIAHDLKNPIGSVLNLTELLAKEFDKFPKSEQRRLAELSYKTSKQALRLLENLLTWSLVQGGRMKVKKTIFNIDDEVEKTIKSLQHAAELKSIDVKSELCSGIEVFADREMISTTVRNLFSNAVKFTPSGKKILVKVVQKDQMAEVRIEDQGIGIPEDQVDKLLQVDSNYHQLGTNKENGTGMGLQLANEFIKLNGGYLTIKSQENKGSRFSIFIPANNSN
ncbi:tetratricopeptide repeat protein [Maribellus comscasis]|uniref:histidine kinase n=1 Tax=Maribellus comscasis TaxID=2681766 RepID=A0A6I6JQK4_9BACT|nr:tetratricopeptide repeat-containing sensor histidine kinase [Maribellus comscasis]QGY43310.1 tetratricopeptide repeat protein [Maribellus comscasis]